MVPALAKRKKKPKKKNAPGVTPGVAGCPAPMGVPEQVATDPPVRVGCQGSHEDTMCINCGCATHFRSECEAPPRCPTTLAYLGYGTERGSFYFVDVEIEEEVPRPHLASVTLAPEQVLPPGLEMSADLIQVELAAYNGDFRDSEFTWEVTETAPLIFSVPFPSAELLRVCSHEFIRCPINKFLISVCAATAELELVPPLEKVWVLVYGLPRGGSAAQRGGKHTHILKAISEPVGKLVTADLASFEDDGPARIEILCPAPTEIDGLSLIFYFGSRGGASPLRSSPRPRATCIARPLVPPSLVMTGERGMEARLRRAPFVRRMMVMVVPLAARSLHTRLHRWPLQIGWVASRWRWIEPVIIVGPSPVVTDLVVQDGVEALGGSSPVATTADDLEFTEADVLSVGMEVCPSPRPLGVVLSTPTGPFSKFLGSSIGAATTPDRNFWQTPEAAGSKARGEDSPMVSAHKGEAQPCLLPDGRSHDPEKATCRLVIRPCKSSSPLPLARPLGSLFLVASRCLIWLKCLPIVALCSGVRRGPSWSRFMPFAPMRSLRGR
ncbi:hypothetical protein ZWY2020_033678 [Hordeum vulgare]|nr:hypothetical protein ZWY2020_033678 [Hordeum vulgare]